MTRRSWLVLVFVGILVAAGASWVVWESLTADQEEAATGPDVAVEALPTVLVANRDIPAGWILGEADMKTVRWPDQNLPGAAFQDSHDALGRVSVASLSEGEILLTDKFAEAGTAAGLSAMIPPGTRGMSVAVDQESGVAGFVLPGTSVDVFVTLDVENPDNRSQRSSMTQLILQDIRVLTAGQHIQRDSLGQPQTVPVVTLMVTPDEGEDLALASTKGSIRLALRGGLDTMTVRTAGAELSDFISMGIAGGDGNGTEGQRRTRTRVRPAGIVIETYRGGQRTETRYP